MKRRRLLVSSFKHRLRRARRIAPYFGSGNHSKALLFSWISLSDVSLFIVSFCLLVSLVFWVFLVMFHPQTPVRPCPVPRIGISSPEHFVLSFLFFFLFLLFLSCEFIEFISHFCAPLPALLQNNRPRQKKKKKKHTQWITSPQPHTHPHPGRSSTRRRTPPLS